MALSLVPAWIWRGFQYLVVKPLVWTLQQIIPIPYTHLQRWIIYISVAVTSLLIAFISSILIYTIFYYIHMPRAAFEKPVHFHFRHSSSPGQIYPFAEALVEFIDHQEIPRVLTLGQGYDLNLDLQVVDSTFNQELGNFMLSADLLHVPFESSYKEINMNWDVESDRYAFVARFNKTIYQSSRAAILKHYSQWTHFVRTWTRLPFIMIDIASESQNLHLPLVHEFYDHPNTPVTHAYLKLSSSILKPQAVVQLYAATLRIDAHFRGLQYFMFYWFLPTSLACILFLTFLQLTAFALFLWFMFGSNLLAEDMPSADDRASEEILNMERLSRSRTPRAKRYGPLPSPPPESSTRRPMRPSVDVAPFQEVLSEATASSATLPFSSLTPTPSDNDDNDNDDEEDSTDSGENGQERDESDPFETYESGSETVTSISTDIANADEPSSERQNLHHLIAEGKIETNEDETRHQGRTADRMNLEGASSIRLQAVTRSSSLERGSRLHQRRPVRSSSTFQ